MSKKILGAAVLAVLALALDAGAQDRTKKTYELIYDDVQALKAQVQDLRGQLERTAGEIVLIKDQLKTLSDLVRQFINDQAGIRQDLGAVPSQYQDLLRRIDQLTQDVQKVAADVAAARAAAPVTSPEGEAAREKPAKEPSPKPKPEAAKPAAAGGQAAVPPSGQPSAPPSKAQPAAVSNISPQQAYTMAYNDYLKGNYDLAIDGFKLYRQQFPSSPLADNALYWIGECYYSQRKFDQAIDSFNELILTYPQGDKVPASYLKKGLAFAELGKKDEALATLKLLVAKYPLQEESRIAQDKIKEIEQR